jgi:hypothetical protein
MSLVRPIGSGVGGMAVAAVAHAVALRHAGLRRSSSAFFASAAPPLAHINSGNSSSPGTILLSPVGGAFAFSRLAPVQQEGEDEAEGEREDAPSLFPPALPVEADESGAWNSMFGGSGARGNIESAVEGFREPSTIRASASTPALLLPPPRRLGVATGTAFVRPLGLSPEFCSLAASSGTSPMPHPAAEMVSPLRSPALSQQRILATEKGMARQLEHVRLKAELRSYVLQGRVI